MLRNASSLRSIKQINHTLIKRPPPLLSRHPTILTQAHAQERTIKNHMLSRTHANSLSQAYTQRYEPLTRHRPANELRGAIDSDVGVVRQCHHKSGGGDGVTGAELYARCQPCLEDPELVTVGIPAQLANLLCITTASKSKRSISGKAREVLGSIGGDGVEDVVLVGVPEVGDVGESTPLLHMA
jgi:hypothetical protein